MTKTTKVHFKTFPDDGGVIAIFPDIKCNNPHICAVFWRDGKHRDCLKNIVEDLPDAKPHEYASLKAELEGETYGYRLEVMNS